MIELTVLINSFLIGASAGLSAALIGYFKTTREEGNLEKFCITKFVSTIIIGTLVGGVTGAFGVEGELSSYVWMIPIVYFADTVAKVFKRRIFDPIVKFFKSLVEEDY